MKDEKLIVTPKQPKGEDGYRTFSIRIREELVKRIDDISTRSGRSRNELIGLFLDYAADHCKIEE